MATHAWLSLLLCVAAVTCVVGHDQAEEATDTDAVGGRSYYELLEVDPSVDEKTLRRSYRKIARKHHPDKFLDPSEKETAQKRFIRLVEAFEVLSDEEKRRRYDELLKRGTTRYTDHEWAKAQGHWTYEDAQQRFKEEEARERREIIGFWVAVVGTFLLLIPVYFLTQEKQKKSASQVARERLQAMSDEERRAKASQSANEQAREAALARGRREAQRLKETEAESAARNVISAEVLSAKDRKRLCEDEADWRQNPVKKGPWDKVELSLLSKAMAKHPGGTKQRWERITEYINSALPSHRRSEKDVSTKAREVGLQAVRSTNPTRLDAKPATSKPSDGKIQAAAPEAEWTPQQQQALEVALRTYPPKSVAVAGAYDTKDRWSLIAAAVEGKTKQQCVKRFKQIREQIRQSSKAS